MAQKRGYSSNDVLGIWCTTEINNMITFPPPHVAIVLNTCSGLQLYRHFAMELTSPILIWIIADLDLDF